jgi:SapC
LGLLFGNEGAEMARFVAVSREAHGQKVWRRFTNTQFAAREALTPIVLAEVVHVGSWMPIVFIEQAGRYMPMAMMSPMPGHNMFVGPDGEWLGGYTPSSLRSHPFRLVRREGSEQMTLYIDEDSGLIRDADEAGEPFFAADGQPSPSISTTMDFLGQIEASRVATDLATASLAAAGVMEPWPLEVEVNGKKAVSKGLHRINESALNGLDDEAFLKLRRTSALRLADAQFMSMGQIARFAQLMRLRQQLAQTPKITPEGVFGMGDSGLIRFDN